MTEPMPLREATLPWNDLPVRTTGNIYAQLASRMPGALGEYLPRSVTVYGDLEVSDSDMRDFIEGAVAQLDRDLRVRERRAGRFVARGLFDEPWVRQFLTGRCHVQPWVIYYSKDGGLRAPVRAPGETGERHGVIPCSTMQNHGVAWRREGVRHKLWLVTARKEGRDWDWDSDIGHESAHAAFAQIPLFVQPPPEDAPPLSSVRSVAELDWRHLSRMGYMFMEMSVVSIRGEQRETATGVPLAEDRDELYALLELSHELMPGLGFDRALKAYLRLDGRIDVNEDEEIFDIGAAVMRVTPHLSEVIDSFDPPTADWYRSLAARCEAAGAFV